MYTFPTTRVWAGCPQAVAAITALTRCSGTMGWLISTLPLRDVAMVYIITHSVYRWKGTVEKGRCLRIFFFSVWRWSFAARANTGVEKAAGFRTDGDVGWGVSATQAFKGRTEQKERKTYKCAFSPQHTIQPVCISWHSAVEWVFCQSL